ncbi:hypothetical protein P3W45_001365 [Vairimorpha bombi]
MVSFTSYYTFSCILHAESEAFSFISFISLGSLAALSALLIMYKNTLGFYVIENDVARKLIDNTNLKEFEDVTKISGGWIRNQTVTVLFYGKKVNYDSSEKALIKADELKKFKNTGSKSKGSGKSDPPKSKDGPEGVSSGQQPSTPESENKDESGLDDSTRERAGNEDVTRADSKSRSEAPVNGRDTSNLPASEKKSTDEQPEEVISEGQQNINSDANLRTESADEVSDANAINEHAGESSVVNEPEKCHTNESPVVEDPESTNDSIVEKPSKGASTRVKGRSTTKAKRNSTTKRVKEIAIAERVKEIAIAEPVKEFITAEPDKDKMQL